MNLSIGEKIKSLRKQNDVTQEKLADYLNISYQAVSKWENGTTLPDISMVIRLANFFGVTTDELLEVDTQRKNQEIEEIEEEYESLGNKGLIDEQITLMRGAVAKYPNNYKLLMFLVHSLHEKESNNEKIAICGRILEDCTDNDIRSSAIQLLTYTYARLENWNKAKEYANKANRLSVCRESLMCHAVPKGEERTEVGQNLVISLTELLTMTLIFTLNYDTVDDEISAYETALKLWQLIFYDENYLFVHVRLCDTHSMLAKAYAKKLNKIKVIEHLTAAKKHGTLYETIPEGIQYYTTIFTNTRGYNRDSTSKSSPQTCFDEFNETVKNICFDFIRDDPEFIALTKPAV
jgi:Predicted transcriptional regulators